MGQYLIQTDPATGLKVREGISVVLGIDSYVIDAELIVGGFAQDEGAREGINVGWMNLQTLPAILAANQTVLIGLRNWAKANYDGVVTAMGTVIPECTDATTWAALTTPAWCYYDNQASYNATLGKLYNGYAAALIAADIAAYNAANPTTPYFWKMPVLADWQNLSVVCGGDAVAGGLLKPQGTDYWYATYPACYNVSGFNARGSGWRKITTGAFDSRSVYGLWWGGDNCFAQCFGAGNNYSSGASLDSKYGLAIRMLKA